ncbi:hypothetical protein PG995_010363 [Apiospora arundinis]
MASPHFVQLLPPAATATATATASSAAVAVAAQQLPQLPQYHYQQQQQQQHQVQVQHQHQHQLQQQQQLPQHPASVTSPTGSTILTPTSANTIYSSPSSFQVKNEVDDRDGSIGVADASEPSRKKQKRNKPTLSCHECVERKTKASSGRPSVNMHTSRTFSSEFAFVSSFFSA